jgi:hypothetical protein
MQARDVESINRKAVQESDVTVYARRQELHEVAVAEQERTFVLAHDKLLIKHDVFSFILIELMWLRCRSHLLRPLCQGVDKALAGANLAFDFGHAMHAVHCLITSFSVAG